MRAIFLMVFLLSTMKLLGQNGYVQLNNDSILTGYLRYYVSINDGHQGIEFWRTKTDKNPLKIPKLKIKAYAIKKDTFKVLHQFKPFQDTKTYFEIIDAKLKARGKINLYIIEDYQNRGIDTGGGLIQVIIDASLGSTSFMYILEDKTSGFLRALPSKKEKLRETLMDFFPEKYLTKYGEVKGEISYKSIPDIVKLYNSR